MKVKVQGIKSEQIKLGIEPFESAEVDVVLSELTPEQREVLARGNTPQVISGTQEDVAKWLQRVVDEELEKKTKDAREQAEQDAAALAWCDAPAEYTSRADAVLGVEYLRYRTSDVPRPHWHLHWTQSVAERVAAVMVEREAEAKRMTEASLAAVADQIEAAKAAFEANAKAAKDEEARLLAEKLKQRLETGIVTVPFTRGSRNEWGEPWIAKVSSRNGRKPEYEFSEGSYDAATEVLSIPCKPGEVIAWGQKNYKKASRTIHKVKRMEGDGRLTDA